jgi:predicted Rossmann fold nucleotide-binding protein DprA/Smf involved in DNA uptake
MKKYTEHHDDNMFEIDIDNNKNAINELLGNQSQFLDPEVVNILKMLRERLSSQAHASDKKQNRQKLFRDEYDALSFDAYYFQQIASNLKSILDQSFLYQK